MKSFARVLIWLLLICSVQSTFAQFPNYLFSYLAIEDGLSSNNIRCIFQDREGFLWIGTADGLNLWNGSSIGIFRHDRKNAQSLCDNFVNAVCEDLLGNIWVATNDGISAFDRQRKTFQSFPLLKNRVPQVFTRGARTVISDHHGNIWAATAGGIFRINPADRKVELFEAADRPASDADMLRSPTYNIAEDRLHHGVWFSCDSGFVFYSHSGNSFYHRKNNPHGWKLFDEKPDGEFCIDEQNKIWYREKRNPGISCFDPAANTITRSGEQTNSYFRTHVFSEKNIFADSKGLLWIGSWIGSPLLYDTRSGRIDTAIFSARNIKPISSKTIQQVIVDKDGTYWIATLDGISYFNPAEQQFELRFVHYHDHGTDRPAEINYVYAEDSVLWIGAGGASLLKFDLQTNATETYRLPLPEAHYVNFVERRDENELWIGSSRGLWIFNDRNKSFHRLAGLPDSFLTINNSPTQLITNGNDGDVWIGTWNKGLFRINPGKEEFHHFTAEGPKSIPVNGLLSGFKGTDGTIWFGFNAEAGVARYRPEENDFVIFRSEPPDTSTLEGGTITGITEDKAGILWLATHGTGVIRFDPETCRSFSITQNEGLPGNYVFNVLCDQRNRIWITTSAGICVYDQHEKKILPVTNEFAFHSTVYRHHGAMSGNGMIYFHKDSALMIIDASAFTPSKVVPHPVITSFRIFDKEHPVSPELKLNYQQNFFSFEIAPLTFLKPEHARYAYMLEGVDRDWIQSSNRNFVSYANLKGGHYTFRFKAAGSNDAWAEGDPLSIVIVPPVWQTGWFRLLLVVAALGLIWFAAWMYTARKLRLQRIQLDKLRAVDQERIRIARDMHDDLGSGLSSIRLLSEVAKRKSGTQNASQEIDKIVKSSSELTEKMGEIVWALNAKNDSLESLISYLRTYTLSYLEDAGIPCHFHLPSQVPDIQLSGEQRRNVFLSVKEALHNIVKHAEAKEVQVSVACNENLEIVVHDNGNGIDLEHLRRFRNGIKNMKARMESVNGKFSIENAEGTTCTFILPFKQTANPPR